jgi:hypothetical protein
MKIIEFLDKLSPIDLREGQVKKYLSNLLWVKKTMQYCSDIERQALAPITVFEGLDGKYRIIDGYKRVEALLICRMINEAKVTGEHSNILGYEIEYRGIFDEHVYVDVVYNQDIKKVIGGMCTNNLTTDSLFSNDYYRMNGYEAIKITAQEEYGVKEWCLMDRDILDLFVAYLTGIETFSNRAMSLSKSEIIASIDDFNGKEFFEFLVKANGYTKQIEAHLEDYKGKRFMVAVATAYHIAKKEDKLVKTIDELVQELLSKDKDVALKQLNSIKSLIAKRVYVLIKTTSYLYLSGAIQTLEWEKVFNDYRI